MRSFRVIIASNNDRITCLKPPSFYTIQGQICDPGPYAYLLDDLPVEIRKLTETIQGLMLHLHWASSLGITLNRIRMKSEEKDLMDRLARLSTGEDRDFVLLLTGTSCYQNTYK